MQNIKDILVNDHNFKIAAYADDLSIGIGSSLDWTTLHEILNKYELASNASINKTKTILLPITENAHRVELYKQSEYKTIEQNQNTITILGYVINTKGEPCKNLWSNMLKKIKSKINHLS